MIWEPTNEEFTNMFGIRKNIFCKVLCVRDMKWYWCDIWCKTYDAQRLFVDDIENTWGKIVYKLLKACMRIDLLYQDRKATKYNSKPVLYVYLLYLKNQIV